MEKVKQFFPNITDDELCRYCEHFPEKDWALVLWAELKEKHICEVKQSDLAILSELSRELVK